MSPPDAKRSRSTVSDRGVLRIECNGVSNADSGWRSQEVEDVVRWSATVLKLKVGRDKEFLSYNIECDDDSVIDVDVQCVLFNEDSSKNFSEEAATTFQNGCEMRNIWFLEWKHATDIREGFVKDDKMVVEIRISMKHIRASPSSSMTDIKRKIKPEIQIPIDFSADIDFTNANDPRHDIAFVIGGEKIYAGKQILSLHSSVFAAMFYGEWQYSKRIKLEEVDRDEFLELLRVIYPSTTRITDSNVHSLLKLADRFEIKIIIELAQQHLIASTSESTVTKLLLSDKHKLAKLKDHCFSSLKTAEDFKAVKESSIYNDLSDATKVAFFEKWVAN